MLPLAGLIFTHTDEDGCEVDDDNFELIEEGALLTVERAPSE